MNTRRHPISTAQVRRPRPVRGLHPTLAGTAAGVAVIIGWCAGVANAEPLEGAVRASLGSAKLEKVRIGVAIVDCDSRQVLASINANDLFSPASNLKLITSGVALSILKDFEFKTSFIIAPGAPGGGESPGGRLIIRGGGDPALCDPKLLAEQGWSVERFLARIVDAARAAKVPPVTEVIVDDRVFERQPDGGAPVHPTWPREQLNQWYCAPVSGLNFFTNCITLRATAGDRVGMKPNVETEPSAPWLINLDLSSARTVKEGSNSLWSQQESGPGGGTLTFKVFGDVKAGAGASGRAGGAGPSVKIDVTVNAPGLLLGRLVSHAMWEAGLAGATPTEPPVRIAADGEDLGAPRPGEPAGAVTGPVPGPFAVITTPLSAVLRRCNVDSQNLYAECLLKRTAYEVTQQPGSWATGSQVVTMRLTEKLGGEAQSIRIVDGSGMSRDNQVSPMVVARWLGALQQDRALGSAFIASMARADDRESKVSRRFIDHRLHNTVYAKTGYIKNVVCLSGYVVTGRPGGDDGPGRTIAFSVLANDVGGNGAKVKDFQEEVVMVIDKWLSRQSGGSGAARAN